MRADARIANPTPLSKRPLTPVMDAEALREARMQQLDKVNTAVTVQGIVQDTAHVASLAGRSAGRAAAMAGEAAEQPAPREVRSAPSGLPRVPRGGSQRKGPWT